MPDELCLLVCDQSCSNDAPCVSEPNISIDHLIDAFDKSSNVLTVAIHSPLCGFCKFGGCAQWDRQYSPGNMYYGFRMPSYGSSRKAEGLCLDGPG